MKSKEPTSPAKLSPFDFINEINKGKNGVDLLKDCTAAISEGANPDSPDRSYAAFIINRGLSYFQDTILYANAMNERSHLPAKMQFDFLRHTIRPMKRFSKWAKRADDTEAVSIIMTEYGYSSDKARDVINLFTDEAIREMKARQDQGGTGSKSPSGKGKKK